MTATFYVGDSIAVMNTLPEKSVDLILTSPPFLALRSYLPQDHPDKALEGGSQATPGEYVDWLLDVVEACARVLAPHGSLCFELGDTYSGIGGAGGDWSDSPLTTKARVAGGSDGGPTKRTLSDAWPLAKSLSLIPETFRWAMVYGHNPHTGRTTPPWRLRNVIRWVRPNPPVGALGDKFRPATSELMVFCKAKDRFFDLDAVRDAHTEPGATRQLGSRKSPNGGDWSREAASGQNPVGAPPLDWWSVPLLDGDEETRYGRTALKPAGFGGPREFDRDPAKARKGTEPVENNPLGAPPLDWWNIPPGGYPGAHYAVWPPELLVKPIKAMCPEKVCRRCGKPAYPIREHLGRERFRQAPSPEVFAVFMRHAMEGSGKTTEEVAAHLGVTTEMIRHYRGHLPGPQLPSIERWRQLAEILPFPQILRESMAIVDREYETTDRGNRDVKERLSGGAIDGDLPKVVQTGSSDCGHDEWRPGVVLDPFAGSGTTLAVATGHGRDAIGIDLDSRNFDLALDRVGPLVLSRAEVAACQPNN